MRAYAAGVADLTAAASGRTLRAPGGSVLAVLGAPNARLNAVISLSPDPSLEEIAPLVASGSPWELPWSIHVCGTPSPLVTELAARHGLTLFVREPLMIRRPEHGMPDKPITDPLNIRAISDDEIGLYTASVADGFEIPRDALRSLTHPSLAKIDGITLYLAELDGVPVGTGMTVISGDLMGIFNVTTLPGYRRRGYGRAITIELIRAGFAAGATTTYLFASKMGEPVYASVGFCTEDHLTMITAPKKASAKAALP
ncbi:GNAT family N-acetyltransferase [Streptomyces heilongjiangensis]|uniref:GNAT family N-acetyltransferase n=1 Tax=Streptomyces heilongjiangensis TaxID=945052 RepID=A0ABW1B0N3_9ACTN|nr:GNAT family N-acetyltransferase [Streptomyces heilongjiangensis]MDC2945612.1 GNAT family N-acetyltransferase [Streptomyces heilongjiangensis]